MKTLYIHGMSGEIREEKLDRLRQANLEVYAQHLKYDHQSFHTLKDYIEQNQIEFLVGYSHGGFLGFWLAEELGLPCLLINPSLSLRSKEKVSPKVTETICPICLVALGADDQLVNPHRTLLYLEKDARPDKIIKTKWIEGEGHRLSLDTLSEAIAWALGEINHLKDQPSE